MRLRVEWEPAKGGLVRERPLNVCLCWTSKPTFLDHPPHCKPPLPNGHAHTLPTLAGSQWGRRRPRSRYSGGCAAQQGGPRAPALLALGELVSRLCAPPPAAALLLLSPLLCCSSCACCLPCVGAASGRRMRHAVAVWDCCLLLVWQEARHAVDGLLLLLEEAERLCWQVGLCGDGRALERPAG